MVECPESGKDFTRRYNMECHRALAHPCADSEEDSSVTEDPSEEIDPGTEVSDSQRSTDDNSISDDQSSTDDEEEDDSVWTSIWEQSWTPEIDDTFDNQKAELVERGMSTSDAHQIAYKRVLPNLRRNIAMNYMKKYWNTPNSVKTLSIENFWKPSESCKKTMIMNLRKPWDMQSKKENISF